MTTTTNTTNPKLGTTKLRVLADLPGDATYTCIFKGSKVIYKSGTGISDLAAIGIRPATGNELSYPVFDTAELIRKKVIRGVNITYKDGSIFKSKRIYVAEITYSDFLQAVAGGNLTFEGKPVTSASASANLKRNA